MPKKKKTLPKSLRKYIREKKSEIRKEVLDIKEQEKKIKEFLNDLIKEKHDSSKH